MALFTGAVVISLAKAFISGGIGKFLETKRDIRIEQIRQDGANISVAKELELQRLENQNVAAQNAKEIRIATKDTWEMRLAVALVAIPTSFHYAAIAIDKTYNMGWNIALLPAPMDDYQGRIILGFFGLGAVKVGINVLAAKLLKK